MTQPVALLRRDGVAIAQIDSPPVNALSPAVISGLVAAVAEFESDRALRALVIACAGRTFVAGGDITHFDDADFETGSFNGLLARIESLDRLVVAALHGTTLGGGLELALACHYRIASPGTKLGFPEVSIGVLPGSLGTQRLPRLVPMALTFEMMLGGRPITAAAALEAGLIDAIEPGAPADAGVAKALSLLAAGTGPRRTRDLPVDTTGLPADFFTRALDDVKRCKAPYPAPQAIVACLEAAARGDFDAGEALEKRLFDECRRSPQSRALRHLFFAEREASRIPGLPKDTVRLPIAKVGIVGAGTMGGGIAMNFANSGIPCVLVESEGAALDRGIGIVRRNYEASVAKGKLDAAGLAGRMALLTGSLDYAALADCDLVIEAVYEDFDLKSRIVARLGQICKASAIIATNTSTLDVDALAIASGRPRDFVGTHFFSPANVMRLLEVVRGAQTSPAVLATVMDLAKRIGKTAAVSGVCYGFIGNRMAEPYMRETEYLLLEGATPAQIDGAVEDWRRLGMAMGPCRMLDMAGIDVGAKTLIELGKSGGLPDDPSYRPVVRRLFEEGRHGQKTGSGYYRYDGRKPVADPHVGDVTGRIARELQIERREHIPDEEIVERLLYSLVNEAAKILQEGIAFRPGDVDVIWTAGYGFPDHRGGPLFMADEIGIARIVERLRHYGARHGGDPFGYWTPAALLTDLATSGQRLSDWRAA